MIFRVDVEQEQDGRWIAEVLELPGAMSDGPTEDVVLPMGAGHWQPWPASMSS